MANVTIDQLTGKTAVITDQLEVQATAGGASNKVTADSLGRAILATSPAVANAVVASINSTLSGANAQSALEIKQAWNTTGNPSTLRVEGAEGAQGSSTLLLDLATTGLGTVFKVDRFGLVTSLIRGFVAANAWGYGFVGGGNTAMMYGTSPGTSYIRFYNGGEAMALRFGGATWPVASVMKWSTGTDATDNTSDTGVSRNAAGVLEVNNGTAGTFRDLYARNVRTAAVTFGTLTAAASAGAGARSFITDGAASPVFSSAAAGGGTLGTPVYSDGTIWRNG